MLGQYLLDKSCTLKLLYNDTLYKSKFQVVIKNHIFISKLLVNKNKFYLIISYSFFRFHH